MNEHRIDEPPEVVGRGDSEVTAEELRETAARLKGLPDKILATAVGEGRKMLNGDVSTAAGQGRGENPTLPSKAATVPAGRGR